MYDIMFTKVVPKRTNRCRPPKSSRYALCFFLNIYVSIVSYRIVSFVNVLLEVNWHTKKSYNYTHYKENVN